ncbi:hypothetical protein PHMEG_00029694 [Phytophthora megakarya]|uniref:Uncharacterized protein n=1 Tax=Phytophthora megakarya TaxID=4795 RepID=A0A225V2Z3_9STRA|nr:hypothetical protein PHMEG_00029694 [Phytophthora megakarya]
MVGAHKPQYWKIIRLLAKCDEEIKCKVVNSNARQYMETCHPQVLMDYEAEQVVPRQLNNLLARWIAVNIRPLALIEDVGFGEVIKFIADLAAVELHLPGRTQIRDDIMRIAAELHLK